jgi:hypothetical protein
MSLLHAGIYQPTSRARPLGALLRELLHRRLEELERNTRTPAKPSWVHLPDRVWRRHSALIMHQYECDRMTRR